MGFRRVGISIYVVPMHVGMDRRIVECIPNALSLLRIALSLCILPLGLGSTAFVAFYILAGLTDVLDGPIARHYGSESKLGERLDTLGDTVLFAMIIVKILPVLDIPAWTVAWILLLVVMKALNICYAYAKGRDFLSLHTVMNKIAGLALFMLPLALPYADQVLTVSAVCTVATIAIAQES